MASQPLFNRMPRALALLAGAIAAAHLMRELSPIGLQQAMIDTLAVFPDRWDELLDEGEYGALAPSMFGHVLVHAGWLHLAFNVVLFVSVGRALAQRLDRAGSGATRFVLIFLFSAACAATAYVAFNRGSTTPALGASGAVCGIYAAYLMAVRGDWRRSMRDPMVLQNGAVFLALNVGLAFAAREFGVLPIAWEAHLGGFIGGMALYPFVSPRPPDDGVEED